MSVAVVEARDRVGGRTSTVHLFDGEACDVGGAYVGTCTIPPPSFAIAVKLHSQVKAGPTQDRILRVAKELGIRHYDTWTKGKSVLKINGKRSIFEGTIPSVHLFALLDLNNLMRETYKLIEQVQLKSTWRGGLRRKV